MVGVLKETTSERSEQSLILRQHQDERPQKEEFMQVEDMLSDLLSKYPELNKNELLSKRQLGKVVSSLADSQKRLRKYEKENGKSWHTLICYPLAPHSFSKMPHLEPQQEIVVGEIDDLLKPGRREGHYKLPLKPGRRQLHRKVSNGIGNSDAVSLLSGTLVARTEGGKQIELEPDFRSKYVLVFCIEAPVLFEFGFGDFQSLLNLCHELHSARGDVDIVMVARMNILADTKEDFNHLFSGFPTSCLAVPYEDWERRERIWKLLDGDVLGLPCFVYDTNGLFLTSFFVDEIPCGAEAFPFDELTVWKVLEKREQLREDRLENLLRPYESSPDVDVYELNGSRKKSFSEVIKNKHVGLYLCCPDYKLLPVLQNLYEQCREKKEEFEIVVLYLPCPSTIDPQVFKQKLESYLQGQNISSGWWCLPFNNSVSLRFWNLTMGYDIGDYDFEHRHASLYDKLIIVGPNGKILDMYGSHVISNFGIDDSYPFTRAAILQKRMQEVRRLGLESLLEGQHFSRGVDPSDTISGDTLLSSKKKIIIIYKPSTSYPCSTFDSDTYDFKSFVSQYKEMKEEFEVVFIEFPEIRRSYATSNMPWYINCPLDGTHTSPGEKLAELFEDVSLVGFGEDGRVCSVKRLAELQNLTGLCLEDTLEQDVHNQFGLKVFLFSYGLLRPYESYQGSF